VTGPASHPNLGAGGVENRPSGSPANLLLHAYVFDGDLAASRFWGTIPLAAGEVRALSQPLIRAYKESLVPLYSQDRLEQFCRVLTSLHHSYGLLDDRLHGLLDRLAGGGPAIEAGHQPALMGGPGLIINKMAAATRLAHLQGAVPLMFVGGHDQEQKELTVVHLPSPGPRGITLALPIPKEYKGSPLHALPKPPKKWLDKASTLIQSTYHELVASSLPRPQRQTYTDRLDHIMTLLRQTHAQATSFSDWTLRLWAQLVRTEEELGEEDEGWIPLPLRFQVERHLDSCPHPLFHPFSEPAVRRLMLPAFEYLLTPRIRSRLISALNRAAEQLRSLGYKPGIGPRPPTYLPFQLECPTPGCHRTRLEPVLTEPPSSPGRLRLEATCPKCRETHSLEVSASHPDLTQWQEYLSPKVDTRPFLTLTYAPIVAHVGGAGETSYYAQVAPALAAVGAAVPVFFRYTRLFYGNPWTRRLASQLEQEGLASLAPHTLRSYRAAVATGYRDRNMGVVRCLFAACNEHIQDTLQRLTQEASQLEKKRAQTLAQARREEDQAKRIQLQREVGHLAKVRQLARTYLSQAFGRYSPERYGQEVSWNWIDMALSLGPGRLFRLLLTHYQPLTPNSATFYLPDQPHPRPR